jgi:hypothetical protein
MASWALCRRATAGAAACAVACASGAIGDPGTQDGAMPDAPTDATPGPTDSRPPVDVAPPPDAAPCVGGDGAAVDPGTGHCYLYFATKVPWDVALAACLGLEPQSRLATSTGQGENNLIAALAPLEIDVWMGGNDLTVEMAWTWITGESMAYTNWRAGEPNDSGGEDCMVMEVDNGGTWDDRPCTLTYPYFCERD